MEGTREAVQFCGNARLHQFQCVEHALVPQGVEFHGVDIGWRQARGVFQSGRRGCGRYIGVPAAVVIAQVVIPAHLGIGPVPQGGIVKPPHAGGVQPVVHFGYAQVLVADGRPLAVAAENGGRGR
jgi:hypothetical protein